MDEEFRCKLCEENRLPCGPKFVGTEYEDHAVGSAIRRRANAFSRSISRTTVLETWRRDYHTVR